MLMNALRPRPRIQAFIRPPVRRVAPSRSQSIVFSSKSVNVSVILEHPSSCGTPIVDYLLQHNKYAPNLSPDDVELMREKERGEFASLPDKERLRRLRIGFANKGRVPWNLGVPHRPETVAKISASVNRVMENVAVRQKLSRAAVSTQSAEVRARISEGLRARYGTVNLQRLGTIKRCKRRPSTVTTGAAMFHCSGMGKSACATFVRPNWNLVRGYLFETPKPKPKEKKPPKPRKARSDDVRARLAESIRLKWQDEEFRRKITESIRESCKTRTMPPRAPPDDSQPKAPPQPKAPKPARAPKPEKAARQPKATLQISTVEDATTEQPSSDDEAPYDVAAVAAKPKRQRYTGATLIAVSRKQRMQLKDRLEKLTRAAVLLSTAEAAVDNLRAQERMLVDQPSALQRVRDAIQKAEMMLSSARETVHSLEQLVQDAQVISDVEDLAAAAAPPTKASARGKGNGNGRFPDAPAASAASSYSHDDWTGDGEWEEAEAFSGRDANWQPAESSNGAADGLGHVSFAAYPRRDMDGDASVSGFGDSSHGLFDGDSGSNGGVNGARREAENGSRNGMDVWDRVRVEAVSNKASALRDVGEFREPSMNGSVPRGQ